jgi:hypothetical protein
MVSRAFGIIKEVLCAAGPSAGATATAERQHVRLEAPPRVQRRGAARGAVGAGGVGGGRRRRGQVDADYLPPGGVPDFAVQGGRGRGGRRVGWLLLLVLRERPTRGGRGPGEEGEQSMGVGTSGGWLWVGAGRMGARSRRAEPGTHLCDEPFNGAHDVEAHGLFGARGLGRHDAGGHLEVRMSSVGGWARRGPIMLQNRL